jgi:hypothetical protein
MIEDMWTAIKCPECAGIGRVEISHGHDPYRGEIISVDICPECDGIGEIAVEPIEQGDLPDGP